MANHSYLLLLLMASPAFGVSQLVHTAKYAVEEEDRHVLSTRSVINPTDVKNMVGKEVTLCGVVFDAQLNKSNSGSTISLQISGEYVNEIHPVQLRIKEPFTATPALEPILSGKNVCINGNIIDEFGKPELLINSTEATNMLEEAKKRVAMKEEELFLGKELILLDNAWLLQGPKWKAPVITHLRKGSIVKIDYLKSGWAFVSVMFKEGTEWYGDENYSGYLFNQALGLNRKGGLGR